MTQTTAAPSDLRWDARELLRFNFPPADLVDASAALFPPARSQNVWGQTGRRQYSESAIELVDGSWPQLQIGPGLVRLMRHDRNADERRRDRQREERAREVRYQAQLLSRPMALAEYHPPAMPTRFVTSWSRKSRSNLVRSILSLDLSPLVLGDRLPVMVTLTLPDRWLEVMPTAAAAAAKFDNFRRAYAKRWGSPQWIWKREFQRRGAPHWHLWLVPPAADLREFQLWLSEAWTTALQITDPDERRRSLAAGTNVSAAEGMRARDPKRLAIYFLKESGAGDDSSKAYQNDAPAAWAGQSVGRFWGVAGIEYQLRNVDLDPQLAARVWRVLRHVRRAKGVTREVRVPRVNHKTGEVRYRKVRRRAAAGGTAGWVAVNDGAAVASQLARFLSSLDLS